MMRSGNLREAVKASPAAEHEPSAHTGIDNFLHLMRHELLEPLREVVELAERMEEMRNAGYAPATLAGQNAFQQLLDASRRSAIIASRLINLGAVLAGPPLLTDERIPLADSLRQVAVELSEMARVRGVGLRFDDSKENLAPIYGSAYWLGVALRALLVLLLETAPAGTHVLLRLRQMGFHQLLTATVRHNRPAENLADLLKEMPHQSRAAMAAASRLETLDLVLVKSIVEIHGGLLKFDSAESGAVSEFHLSLPTGEPYAKSRRTDCGQCQFVQQAEQFAQDIGALLKAQVPVQAEFTIYNPGRRK
jgi:signal transduction histidine kinase